MGPFGGKITHPPEFVWQLNYNTLAKHANFALTEFVLKKP